MSGKGKPRLTESQRLLALHLEELGFSGLKFEYQFNASRKWRADIYAEYLSSGVCLFECDGGMFGGGHKRGAALEKDYERQNWAAANNFKLFRFTNREVLSGKARQWIEENLL